MATSISFDGNDLQTANILTADISHANLPAKDAAMFALANSNRSTIPNINYPNKVIRISGKIIGSTIADLDSRLDTFRGYFRGQDKNLDIGYNGSTRRYIATLNSINIDRPGGLQWAEFSIEFVCTQPFGRNTASTSALSATGRTLASYTDSHTFIGTAPYQLPVVTITLTAVTGGNSFMSFTNSGNGQGITIIDQTFVNGDVVVIDSENLSVKLNGIEIDFLGAFPEFEVGSQDFSYNDGFTTRTFDIDVDYYPLYF